MNLLLPPSVNSKNLETLAKFLETESPPHCLSGLVGVPMWNIRHRNVVTGNAALGEAFELLFINALLHLGLPSCDVFYKHNNSICAELDIVIKRGHRLLGVFLKTSSRERWKQVRGDSICYHFDVGRVKNELLESHKCQSLELWSVSFMEHFSKERKIQKISRHELVNPLEELETSRRHASSYFGVDPQHVCGIFDALRIADLERSLLQRSPAWATDGERVFEEVLGKVAVSSKQIQLLKQAV
jgi:hypothetical protein